jgi:hypothetical protein
MRVFLPYVGGVDRYRKLCDKVVEKGYLGYAFDGPGGARCNDGVVARMQLDVAMVLELFATLGLPPLESMDVKSARMAMTAMNGGRPPGPSVGEIVDGMLPGARVPSVIGCIGPRPRVRTRSSFTSTAAGGCSEISTRTIPSVSTSAR